MSVSTYEEVTQRDEKALVIKKKVDELLERKEYEQIISLFKEEEVRRLAGCNRNIYILYTIIHTTEFEIKSNDKPTIEGKSTDEIIRIYRIICLFLRRIELDLPLDKQMEIVDYIYRERINLEMIMGIIQNNTYIIKKQKVLDGVVNLFMERGKHERE